MNRIPKAGMRDKALQRSTDLEVIKTLNLSGGTLHGWTKIAPEGKGYRKMISVSGLAFFPMD